MHPATMMRVCSIVPVDKSCVTGAVERLGGTLRNRWDSGAFATDS